MASRRPFRLLVFVLEIFRLALVLTAASVSGAASAAAFAAPHALFALMALFLWIDSERFDPYRALFAGGKLVSAAALGAFLARSFPTTLGMGITANSDALVAFAALAPVALYDVAGGVLAALSFLRPKDGAAPPETLPVLVVDELPDDAGGS